MPAPILFNNVEQVKQTTEGFDNFISASVIDSPRQGWTFLVILCRKSTIETFVKSILEGDLAYKFYESTNRWRQPKISESIIILPCTPKSIIGQDNFDVSSTGMIHTSNKRQ
jgi:hypothetical protein